MPDMTVTCTITRTELSLSNLDVNASPHSLWRDGVVPGPVQWNRSRVGSPFVHGLFTTHAVKGDATLELQIKTKAASDAALWTAIDALVAAVEQTAFTVTLTADGSGRSWACEAADYSLGRSGEIASLQLREHWQVLKVIAPRSPVPLVGAI